MSEVENQESKSLNLDTTKASWKKVQGIGAESVQVLENGDVSLTARFNEPDGAVYDRTQYARKGDPSAQKLMKSYGLEKPGDQMVQVYLMTGDNWVKDKLLTAEEFGIFIEER